MLLIDEFQLTYGTIAQIGECYGMEYDYDNYNATTFNEYIEMVVAKLQVKEQNK